MDDKEKLINELAKTLRTKDRLTKILGKAAITFYERWQASEARVRELEEGLKSRGGSSSRTIESCDSRGEILNGTV